MPASTPTPDTITFEAASPVGPRTLWALREGRRVAAFGLRPVTHPGGLAGACLDVALDLPPGSGTLLPAILPALAETLRAEGVDALTAAPTGEQSAAFAAAGFQAVATGCVVKELVSPLWRRGRVFVIAEAGSNWRMGERRRDIAMGRALIDVAVEAGADAVKFQTYRPETVYVANAGQSDYLADSGIKEEIRDIFADLAMPYDMLDELAAYSRRQGIQFMSTGFSLADFDAIDPFVEMHKIASYEISHVRLIDAAAKSGKPTVFSTGASDPVDIAWAVDRFHAQGGRDLCLLQCTAKYPAPLSSVNLGALAWLRRNFGVPVGLSDHSRDPITAPVGAVALGARCVEKHYTLHNALPGPDHSFAITPDELTLMIAKIREAEQALGSGIKEVREEERELAAFARRGIQALRAITKGEALSEGGNVDILRPGKQRLGMHPRLLAKMEGRIATRDIPAGDGIQPGDWG